MVRELRHPVLVHKLSRIRDVRTPKETLRSLLREIGSFMVYELLSDLQTGEREIETWLGVRSFPFVREEEVVFVAVLRAGLPMLEGALSVLPGAGTGFLAAKRNEETLESRVFYTRLPDLAGRKVVILDPRLATGGTLISSLREVVGQNPSQTVSVHIVCAPEGIERVRERFPQHRLLTVSVDEGLNSRGYIVPGLGDMGDRLYS